MKNIRFPLPPQAARWITTENLLSPDEARREAQYNALLVELGRPDPPPWITTLAFALSGIGGAV